MSLLSECLADNPLVGYKCDEPAGSPALEPIVDYSGNNRDGVWTNVPTLGEPSIIPSETSTCANIDGIAGDIGTVAEDVWMDVTSITLEQFIKPDALGLEGTVWGRDQGSFVGANKRCWHIKIDATGHPQFIFWASDGGAQQTLTSSTALTAGQAAYVVGSYDGATAKLKVGRPGVDALPVTVATLSIAGAINTGQGGGITIGQAPPVNDDEFNGDIQWLFMYGTALSDARTDAHYLAATTPSNCPTGYEVRIDGGAPIDVGLDLDHTFTGLTPETEYELEVRSYGPGGFSDWVSTVETTTATIVESFVTGVISTCPQSTVQWNIAPISTDVFVSTGAVNPTGSVVLAQDEPVLITGPTTLSWNNPGLTDYRPALFVECPGITITMSTTCFEEEPVDATNCYDDYLRRFRSVTAINGPSVTAKMPLSDGAEVWSSQFTLVAANPNEYSAVRPLIEGFLNPAVGDPYVGGLPDGASYDEAGFVQTEPDCPVPYYTPIYDPLCPAVVPPPPVPGVALSCFSFPPNYIRRYFTIPADEVTQWGDAIPQFEISAPDGEVRNLRLRFYADPTGDTDPNDDPCAYLADVVFSYIPDGATLVFDGTDELVYVEDSQGRRRADSLVFATDGKPFSWPVLNCGYGYVVTVDLPQVSNLPVIDMSLVARVV